MEVRKLQQQICPWCSSDDVRPIVYGYPSEEATDAEERGEVILGGCLVSEGQPEWVCIKCRWAWLVDTAGTAQATNRWWGPDHLSRRWRALKVIPEGCERCSECGEFRGVGITPDQYKEVVEVTCLCQGEICGACGAGRRHAIMRCYYREADGKVIYSSSYAGPKPCPECGKRAWQKAGT